MQNQRASFYSRLKPEDEALPTTQPQVQPLEHALDKKKLQSRCCMALSSALLIAFVLWVFDPPAGHETPPDPENTHTHLKFVLVLHRHGARSSLHNYTFEEGIEWDVPPGKLLNAGFEQGFKLGKSLRSRYWSQLSASLASSINYASTDVDRTVDTAYSVLMGVLTDNSTKRADRNCSCRPPDSSRSEPECIAQCLGLEPISNLPEVTVWNSSVAEANILRQYDVCHGYEEWKKKVTNSDEYKNAGTTFLTEEFNYAEKEIVHNNSVCPQEIPSKCNNMTVGDLENMWSTVQCLKAQKGSKNGPYTNLDENSEKLEKAAEWFWHHTYAAEQGPSLGGILLDRIIRNLGEGVKAQPSPRDELPSNQDYLMVLYSAHDSTLASLLAAMNLTDWHLPLFASHIVFELYGPDDPTTEQTPDHHYVQILYDEKRLKVGSCQTSFCQLSQFEESMKDRRQTNKDCRKRKP